MEVDRRALFVSALFSIVVPMTLLGCGPSSGSTSEKVTNPELVFSADDYVREPDGCPPLDGATNPVLPLPWDRRVETFVPPGTAVPTFALDYDVVPLATVEALTFEYDFNARTQPAASRTTAHCPATLASSWLPAAVNDDVVRARVRAVDADDHGRSADLFVSVGTRTITVPLSGLDLSVTNDENWYALFEPGWGTSRVALMTIPNPAPSMLAIPNLPAGPGRIAIVQTASVVGQDDSALLHAPAGFAGDFGAYSRGWYQSVIDGTSTSVTSLVNVVPRDATPTFAALGDDVAWVPANGPLVVSVPSTEATGTVSVPCGVSASLVATGFGNVSVAANGGTATALVPGQAVQVPTSCSGGASSASWLLSTSTLNGRGFDIVIREGTP